MERVQKAAPTVLLPLMLAGCFEWHHPAKSPDQFVRDDAECQQKAFQAMPPNPHQQPAPKWMSRGLGTQSYMVDANEMARGQWRTLCLQMIGWSLRPTTARQDVVYTDQYRTDSRYSRLR